MIQRHRRNPDEVTRDRLRAKLAKQNDEVVYWKNGLEARLRRVEQTLKALDILGMTPPPGFDPPEADGEVP